MDISSGTKLRSEAPLQPQIDKSLDISCSGEGTGYQIRQFPWGPDGNSQKRIQTELSAANLSKKLISKNPI